MSLKILNIMKENSFKSISVITDNFLTIQEGELKLSKRGSNILLYNLIKEVKKKNSVRFEIFQQGEIDRKVSYEDFAVNFLESKSFLNFKEKLRKTSFNSDIIHYNNIDLFTEKAKNSLSTATIHTNSFLEKPKAKKWLKERIDNFDTVVAVNSAYIKEFRNMYLIKNGIPIDKFEYDPKRHLSERIKILFPNINSPKKNRGFGVELVKILNQRQKGKFKLILVGEKENLCLGEEEYEFVGIRQSGVEMNELYKEAFITIIPSFSESCSLCALESMASGTIVFANDILGIRDYIIDERTGFLIDVKQPRVWAGRIESLLRDKEDYDKIQQGARDTVVKEYSSKRMSEDYYLMWLRLWKTKNGER
jgi:glycosyltransferase involved in cell wall biosynthesis